MIILLVTILCLTFNCGSCNKLADVEVNQEPNQQPNQQQNQLQSDIAAAPPIQEIENQNFTRNDIDISYSVHPKTVQDQVFEAPPIFPVIPRNFDNGTLNYIPLKVSFNKTNDYDNVGVYQFLGIPYAMPPIGKNRFQLPQPIGNLSDPGFGRRVCQSYRPSCMQFRMPFEVNPLANHSKQLISENCLYLNIYVPYGNDETKLPVMVWIPGDGFDFATANQFDGTYLSFMGNVIVVVVQYRVGVFGFLQNNAGIYDQLAALKFIRQNIGEFGGDPEQITLFGHYTGSMSITLLLNSPLVHNETQALFQKVILTGGVIVPHWNIEKSTRHSARKQFLLEKLHIHYEDLLQNMNALKLLKKSGFGWRPTYDPFLFGNLSAFNFPPQVNSYMFGHTENEGFQYLLYIKTFRPRLYDRIIANNVTESEYIRLADEMEKMFYQNEPVKGGLRGDGQVEVNRTSFVHYAGYRLIDRPMKDYIQKIYKANKFSLRYKLDHKPLISNAPEFLESSSFRDEVLFLFGYRLYNEIEYINPNEYVAMDSLVKLYSSFSRKIKN